MPSSTKTDLAPPAAPDPGRPEIVVEGLGVSAGIGIGTAYVLESGSPVVPEYRIPAGRIEEELNRFREAVVRSRRQIGRLRTKTNTMKGAAAEEMGFLLDAYIHMLRDSRLMRGAERRIVDQRINAEAAVKAEIDGIADGFAQMHDAYIAARLDDIRDVANRLLRNLTKKMARPLSVLPPGTVVVAEELTPADTAQLDPSNINGFATVLGGAQGHTAIMARALGLPAVLGAADLLRRTRTGDSIVVDGDAGRVVVNPTPETLDRYEHARESRLREARQLERLRALPAVTRDGTEIQLMANVELPVGLETVHEVGGRGIGLLRSEFMFMNREDVPAEEEQYQFLKRIVEAMDGLPVTVRTLDVGGEKTAAALMGGFGESAQSALGLRGIRLSLARPDLLRVQFQAILRAAVHGRVRILLPMVSAGSEIRRAREILVRAARRLKRRRVPIPEALPPLGTMIEVPSAALAADALARESDFFAIGSNDLTMYTLAIDRGDEQVAHLYDPLHPALLRLIQFTTEAALRARIPVSMCGEMAGDPRFTALLLGLGIRELSMNPANLPKVKQRIREMELTAANRRAGIIMDQTDSGRIAMLLDDFNALA